MKKLVLAMACVLSLALLASCKQAASTQDVNLKNQEKSESSAYIGALTVSADPVSLDTTAHAYKSTTSTTDAFVVNGFATVKWEESSDTKDTNYKLFTISYEGAIDSVNTDTALPTSYSTKTIEIYLIGGEYYVLTSNVDANNNVTTGKTKIKLESGDPASGSFEFTGLGVLANDTSISYSKITFKAAE